MMTPQQYKGELPAKWKDTSVAYATVGRQEQTTWGDLTYGIKVGEINGLPFRTLSSLNSFEHDVIDGATPGTARALNPSSKEKILVGLNQSLVHKIAGTTIGGFALNANFAEYINVGNALNSFGVGPVVSIGSARNTPLPGAPQLQSKGFSLTAGILFEGVISDVSVPNLNHYQAQATIGANVGVGRWILGAGFAKPLTPQTRHGVGGPNMSQFNIQASVAF